MLVRIYGCLRKIIGNAIFVFTKNKQALQMRDDVLIQFTDDISCCPVYFGLLTREPKHERYSNKRRIPQEFYDLLSLQ